MKFDDLASEMEADSRFDITNLVAESAKLPYLFNKYQQILYREKFTLEKYKIELAQIKRKRLEYYMGHASDEEYRDNPFHVKIHRSDLDTYLESDDQYSTQNLKTTLQDQKVCLIKDFLNEINRRSFTIKNINDTRRHESGGIV